MTVLRRLASLAPLRPVEALIAVATGVALWVLAIVTPRPDWAPDWTGVAISALGIVILVRGVIGLFGLVDVVRGLIRPKGWPGNRAPRSEAEIADLLGAKRRRDGWEYYLTAAYLILGRERVEPQYLDHQLRYRPAVTERVDDDDIQQFLHAALSDVERIVDNANTIFGSDLQERAFGPPRTPGDATAIRHLTDRMTGFYEELIGWASRLRGVQIHDDLRRLLDLTTRLVDDSVEGYRTFVDDFVAAVDGPMTEAVRTHGEWEGNLTLVINISDVTLAELNAEIDRLKRTGW
jgi:hypothetical protein